MFLKSLKIEKTVFMCENIKHSPVTLAARSTANKATLTDLGSERFELPIKLTKHKLLTED